MPNIRSQSIGSNGIQIIASDGRTFSVTRLDIRNNFLSQTGTLLQRIVKTRLWLRESIRDSLGVEQIDPTRINFDFDNTDGTPTQLEETD